MRFTRWRSYAVASMAALLMPLLVGLAGSAALTAPEPVEVAAAVPNRYIVRLKPAAVVSASSLAAAYDARPGVRINQIYGNVFSGFAGEFTNSAALALAADPTVLDVVPDRISFLAAQVTPPGIGRIDADLNPTHAGDGSGSVDADIAVLDTGIYKHPDLNVVGGKDCTRTRLTGPYHDFSGHGTHVAGTAAARDNGDGVVGVAPGARLWAVKIFSDDGRGAALESEVTCGLDYVRGMAGTIEVINLSIGANYGYDLGGCAATPYHQAYCNVVASGVTVVVAAQNWTINARTVVPAQFDEVITVSAYYDSDGRRGGLGSDSDCTPYGGVLGVQKDDTFACFSNYGADIDISAPGMDVYSTYSLDGDAVEDECPSETYCYMSGTSMATPHVAGAIALIAAQQGRMSPASTKSRLLLAAERGPVPLDPDGIPEPMLNVAQLGKGAIAAPAKVKVGERVTVSVTGFTPGERAIFRLDGTYVGGDTIDELGNGTRTFTVPATASELRPMTVSTGQRTATAMVAVNPLIRLVVRSGMVGDTVDVRLRGFGTGESVVIWFDTGGGVRSMVRVTTSLKTGSANSAFVAPPSTHGNHRVSAVGNKGSSTYASWFTESSAYIGAGTPEPGLLVRAQARGFAAGETVEARFDGQDGQVLGTLTASGTGSGSVSVRIPLDAAPGGHDLWLVGSMGNVAVISLSIAAGAAPTATAAATLEPTPTIDGPTETAVVPTEPATATPTPSVVDATPVA